LTTPADWSQICRGREGREAGQTQRKGKKSLGKREGRGGKKTKRKNLTETRGRVEKKGGDSQARFIESGRKAANLHYEEVRRGIKTVMGEVVGGRPHVFTRAPR